MSTRPLRTPVTRARAIASIVLVSGLAGCASGLDSAVFMAAPPVASAEEVRIYQSQLPRCEYEEVGIVTWRPVNGWQKLQGGVDRMRERAATMGGHAIVAFSVAERANGTSTTIHSDSTTTTVGSSITTETLVSGTVIRYRDGACG